VIGLGVTHAGSLIYWKILSTGCQPAGATESNDLITLGGKFPRLMKKDARARLKEIKKLLLAL